MWVRYGWIPGTNKKKRKWCRLYRIWDAMRTRCTNPNHNSYKYYGAKGVKICDEWKDYAAFRAWAIANGYGKGLSIDRLDSDGDYCPENCRWATPRQQMYNCQQTAQITFRGQTLPSPIWARRFGLHPQHLRMRLRSGWTVEEALTTPKGQRR